MPRAVVTLALLGLVAASSDPSHAIVGQKNHGLTLTGCSLGEIFDRLADRVVRHVPMDS
jgi:hypothetical protein